MIFLEEQVIGSVRMWLWLAWLVATLLIIATSTYFLISWFVARFLSLVLRGNVRYDVR